ncbi:MAG TPA: rhomboid family intramembrane serine protease [Gemmataceae bacterium]|nr:rhomboid family intramembrane serine protease [Gemmataceae bacterium]
MSLAEQPPLERILRACAAAAPEVWYPADYARAQGVNRDDLDPYLDQLRLSGLIRLTDWVQGRGQGYALTPAGAETLESPKQLARLRQGQLPTPKGQPAVPARRSNLGASRWERGEAAREAFLTRTVPSVTFTLIALNVIWFLFGLLLAQRAGVSASEYFANSTPDVLIQTGALNGGYFYGLHQWWRLFSCAFVHIGIIHLGANMLSLYWVGPFLEQVWGHVRYLVLYVVAIIGGSCGMLIEAMLGRHDTLAAGASGAIWGIFASLGTWLFLNRRALPPPFVRNLTQALVINLVINLGLTFGFAGISKGGHFGGGIVGILVAVPLDYVIFVHGWRRWLTVAGVLAVPAVSLGIMFWMLQGPGGAVFKQAVVAGERQASARDWAHFRNAYGAQIDQVSEQASKAYDDARKLLEQRLIDADDAAQVRKGIEAARQELKTVIDELDQARETTAPVDRFKTATAEYLQQFDAVLAVCAQDLGLAEQPPGNEKAASRRKQLEENLDSQVKLLKHVREAWYESLQKLKRIDQE